MSTVTSNGNYNDSSTQQATTLGVNVTPIQVTNTLTYNFGTSGTGADQCTKMYSALLSFTGSPIVLNLFDSSSGTQIVDPYGTAISLTKVRKIFVLNTSTTNANVLLMGYSGVTANAWTGLLTNPGQITIEPSTSVSGGGFIMTAPNTSGWAVSTSSKLLQFDPAAATFTAYVQILGI